MYQTVNLYTVIGLECNEPNGEPNSVWVPDFVKIREGTKVHIFFTEVGKDRKLTLPAVKNARLVKMPGFLTRLLLEKYAKG